MPKLYRVFVSHAAGDRWIAERIAEALRARGARPFLDVYDIEKGDNMLRLGTPRRVQSSQPRGDTTVTQTFTADQDHLKFAFRIFSWDNRGDDYVKLNLTYSGSPFGTIALTCGSSWRAGQRPDV